MHNRRQLHRLAGQRRPLAGAQAEELGVEIYPGMAASAPVTCVEDGAVKGVVAGVFGIAKDGQPQSRLQPGMELHGKYVFIAEGVRGSLAKVLMAKFNLRADKARAAEVRHRHQGTCGRCRTQHKPGLVQHTTGWPLDDKPAAAASCITSGIAT
jgi:electron-transferring-flavoprotein dehydrogenase